MVMVDETKMTAILMRHLWRRLKFYHLRYALVLVAVACIFTYINWQSKPNTYITFYNGAPPEQACVHPDLFANSEAVASRFKKLQPLQCRENMWLYVQNGKLLINTTAVTNDNIDPSSLQCTYQEMHWVNDFTTSLSQHMPLSLTNGHQIPTEFFLTECIGYKQGRVKFFSKRRQKDYHAHIVVDQTELEKMNKQPVTDLSLNLDVILFAFDSVSSMAWRHLMPLSYNYMVAELGTIVLEGYNIVGDGTPAATTPILTGKNEWELPDCLKRHKNSSTVDIYPMIWQDFKKHGFMTQWIEDQPHIATYTYRMRGFKVKPVDHYMRTWYLRAYPHYKNREPTLCIGDKPRHVIAINYLLEFLTKYKDKRKFSFFFFNEVSHDDINTLQYADKDFLKFLKEIKETGILDRSLLIAFSDHGARFHHLRDTSLGLLEERMPFMSVTLPPRFKHDYPQEWANLKNNIHRLTTPYDIHPFLQEFIEFRGAKRKFTVSSRGISLFAEVPLERTCRDAGVDNHWCTCVTWETLQPSDKNYMLVANAVVDAINEIVADRSDVCVKISLVSVERVSKMKAKKEVLTFDGTIDDDGQVASFKGKEVAFASLDYQVVVLTDPGESLFEATVKLSTEGVPFVEESSISRINAYGRASHCIYNERDDLRKYCYCKDLLRNTNHL